MKNRILPFFGLILAILLSVSCQKDDDPTPTIETEELIYAELAFPGQMGESVTIQFDGAEVECEYINGYYVYQGDMLLNIDQTKSSKGGAITATSMRWPYGVVYYTINSNLPNQNRITDAIKHWEARTDLVFEERTDEEDYLEFVLHPDGCYSWVGMKGGRQEVNIANWGTTGNVIHEIGHAIGLIHEHSKKNRDDYIIILWGNIIPRFAKHFNKKDNCLITEGLDFGSVMMYASTSFRRGTEPTITKKDGSTFTVQRNGLSDQDVEMVSMIYSDLHDPVYEFGFADMPSNVHITSDGIYYYTVGDGSYYSGKVNKFDKDGTWLATYQMDAMRGRGLSYNHSDGFLYASIEGGHIVRLSNLETGKVDTIYTNVMQNPECSFALSADGEKYYDFYEGTLRVVDFVNGQLITTITGLSCGSDIYYGAGVIAVDVTYMYTWDASWGIVYVYNHKGVLQRTLEIERGDVGPSLSIIEGYLFVADDPLYDPGFWWVYNIRNPIKE